MENNELIKIKEDAIKIKEHDLDDTIKSIENENIKSSFVLGFSGILFGIVFGQMNKILIQEAIIFTLLLSIIISLWNITAKKVETHTNVDEIFINNRPREWEEYLNYKYLRLNDNYKNAKKLLYQKSDYTKASFILLIFSSLFFSFL